MKIHYYMQYFPGENAVGAQQPATLARFMAQKGHEVTVISTDYNLDTGKAEEALVRKFPGGGCLEILRIYSPRGGRGRNFQRLFAYIYFMANAIWAGLHLSRPDVIISSIQPMFTGLAGSAVAIGKNVPFVLEVRDLWPDALIVKEAVSPLLAKPMFWITDFLYKISHRIISLTPGIKTELVKKNIHPEKIDVFPNGFDPNLFNIQEGTRKTVRRKYGWDNQFIAIYTGSYTTVTAVHVFVETARHLSSRKDIRFAFFGDGPTKTQVVNLARSLGLDNVTFYDPIPKKQVPEVLAAADVALIALFNSPLIHIYFENKFIDYMGAGKPILAAMGGEQARIIEQFGAGKVTAAFNSQGLACLIRDAADNPEKYRAMGQKGRQLVLSDLLLPEILKRYLGTVETIARNRHQKIRAWEPLR